MWRLRKTKRQAPPRSASVSTSTSGQRGIVELRGGNRALPALVSRPNISDRSAPGPSSGRLDERTMIARAKPQIDRSISKLTVDGLRACPREAGIFQKRRCAAWVARASSATIVGRSRRSATREYSYFSTQILMGLYRSSASSDVLAKSGTDRSIGN